MDATQDKAARKAARKAAKKAARLLETPEERKARKEAKRRKKEAKQLAAPNASPMDGSAVQVMDSVESGARSIAPTPLATPKRKRQREDNSGSDSSSAHGELKERKLQKKKKKKKKQEKEKESPSKENEPSHEMEVKEPERKRAKLNDGAASKSSPAPPGETNEAAEDYTNESPEDFRKRHQMEIMGLNETATAPYQCPAHVSTFEASSWPKSMKSALLSAGFSTPTPIQAQAWPICLEGRDIISVARTGSGKTLGFLLPAFDKIRSLEERGIMGDGKNPRACAPLAVVLAPTRELAMQIGVEGRKYGQKAGVRCVCVYGGESKYRQIRNMERLNPQLIIATPGRLNDFCNMGKVNLSRCCILILDEADRMLDMGFEPQLNDICAHMPRQTTDSTRPLPSAPNGCDQYSRHTMLFSATWPKSVQRVAARLLVNPIQLNVGNSKVLVANEKIHQTVMVMQPNEKFAKCREILKTGAIDVEKKGHKVIVFMMTKKTCDMVADALWKEGLACDSLHGDKEQWQRTRIMNSFKNGTTRVLFATDVAARGLDVKDITHVICYDFPKPKGESGIEDFVHRIGRTARGGATGEAITFFTYENKRHAGDLVGLLKRAKQDVPPELEAMVVRRGFGGGRRRGWGGRRGRGGGRRGGFHRGGGRGGHAPRRGRW